MTRQHDPRTFARPASRAEREAPELSAFDLVALASPGAVAATLVREARREAGLSLAELGRRAGVAEQVVALWEDPTWEGHSLSTLRRVAKALDLRLELRFAPTRERRDAAVGEPVAA